MSDSQIRFRLCYDKSIDKSPGNLKEEATALEIIAETVRYRGIDFILAGYSFGWRAYPQNFPSYGNRSTDLDTLWLVQEQEKYFINWPPIPQTLEACEAAVIAWADMTYEYIATGKTIEAQFQQRYYGGQSNGA